ncbi:MAG: hypothetical protein ABFD89_03655 [Bryobacteraceae bacterium]
MTTLAPTTLTRGGHWTVRSTDSLNLADGQKVSAWVDLVSGQDLVQATEANQPTFHTGKFGSYGGVCFSGYHNLARAAFFITGDATNMTVVFVARCTGETLFPLWASDANFRYTSFTASPQTLAYNNAHFALYGGSEANFIISVHRVKSANELPKGVWRINGRAQCNGQSTGTSFTGASNGSNLYLGRSGTYNSYMEVAEILVIRQALTDEQLLQLEAWYLQTFGIAQPSGPCGIIAVGNSTTARGWPEMLRRKLVTDHGYDPKIYNFGYEGGTQTTIESQDTALTDVNDAFLEDDLVPVIVQFHGHNDFGSSGTAQGIAAADFDAGTFHNARRTAGAKYIVMGPTPRTDVATYETNWTACNDHLITHVAAFDALIDLRDEVWADAITDPTTYGPTNEDPNLRYYADAVHPSLTIGNNALAAVVEPEVYDLMDQTAPVAATWVVDTAGNIIDVAYTEAGSPPIVIHNSSGVTMNGNYTVKSLAVVSNTTLRITLDDCQVIRKSTLCAKAAASGTAVMSEAAAVVDVSGYTFTPADEGRVISVAINGESVTTTIAEVTANDQIRLTLAGATWEEDDTGTYSMEAVAGDAYPTVTIAADTVRDSLGNACAQIVHTIAPVENGSLHTGPAVVRAMIVLSGAFVRVFFDMPVYSSASQEGFTATYNTVPNGVIGINGIGEAAVAAMGEMYVDVYLDVCPITDHSAVVTISWNSSDITGGSGGNELLKSGGPITAVWESAQKAKRLLLLLKGIS